MKKVTLAQVTDRIKTENPWWGPDQPLPAPFAEWRPRAYLDLFYPLLTNLRVNRAVVLMGPRRVGKTVMIHHAIGRLIREGVEPREILYVSVDHPIYHGLGLEDILKAASAAAKKPFPAEGSYVFFDEIQYLPKWEVHLKALVDRNRAMRFCASGSAAAALRLKSHESGAGRFTEFLLPPLTFYEYMELLGKSFVTVFSGDEVVNERFHALNRDFLDYLNYGGYPEVVLSRDMRRQPERYVKSDIIDKVLLRDLPSLYGIEDVTELNDLFTSLAFNTAEELSLDELAKNSGAAKNTIKRYVEYLEAAFLVRVVHRVDRNARKFRRATSFKVYLTNPSLRAALFGPLNADDEGMGHLVESAVFSQWFHSDLPIHYARWRSGEVDIVNLSPAQRVEFAVEVKWSDRYFHRPDELRGLVSFCQNNNLTEALVTTRTCYSRNHVKLGNVTLDFVPASVYCYVLSRGILQGGNVRAGLPT